MSRAEAEDFLYREARLLDERRFDEWLQLFALECRYWVPCGSGEETETRTHLVYDGRSQLEDRVWVLLHPRHSSQQPPSFTTHLISNVEVEPISDGELLLRSCFVLYEVRETEAGDGSPRSFAGRNEHLLRSTSDGWQIAMKRIWLLDRNLPMFNLTFLL